MNHSLWECMVTKIPNVASYFSNGCWFNHLAAGFVITARWNYRSLLDKPFFGMVEEPTLTFFGGELATINQKEREESKRGYTVDLWGERGAVFPFKHDVLFF